MLDVLIGPLISNFTNYVGQRYKLWQKKPWDFMAVQSSFLGVHIAEAINFNMLDFYGKLLSQNYVFL